MTRILKSFKTIFIFILILQVVVMCFWANEKDGYFCDEMFTYGLSNSYEAWHLYERDDYLNQWHDSSYWSDYLTVQNGQRLEYDIVVRNQIADDTHPPLYYFVIHTICSLFPDTFSKWFGILPNIAFFVIAQIFLYLIAKELFGDTFSALIPCILYGFSVGAINSVILIRMYMMLASLFIVQYYLHIRLWRSIENGNKKKQYLLLGSIFVNTLVGFMTQYYFLIFAFFVSAVFSIYQMLRRRWTFFAKYVLAMGAALACGYFLYPSCIDQILGDSARGQEAFNNFQATNLSQRFSTFWGILSSELFFGGLTIICVLMAIALIVRFARRHIQLNCEKDGAVYHVKAAFHRDRQGFNFSFSENGILFLAAFVATLCYLVIVSKVAAFEADRYIFAIFPFIVLIVYSVIKRFAGLYTSSATALNAVLLCVALTGNIIQYHNEDINYLYKDQGELKRHIAAEYPDIGALYVTFGDWSYVFNTTLLESYSRTYCLDVHDIPSSADIINEYAKTHDNMMVHVSYTYRNEWEQILKEIIHYTDFNTYEMIFENSDGIYVLSKEQSPDAALDNGFYRIYTADLEKALMVEGTKTNNEANVVITDRSVAELSAPLFVEYSDNQCVFYFEHSGKVLDVYRGLAESGTNVQQYERNEWDAQFWKVVLAEDGENYYVLFKDKTALTYDPLTSNVFIDTFNGTDCQKWSIRKAY